jgi:Protein of unknown function (DUF664)
MECTLLGDERAQLEACLTDARAEIGAMLDGLTEDEGRRKLVPSSTTLLGLVKHAVFVEQVWFQVSLAGRSRAEIGTADDPEASFALTERDTIATVAAAYHDAVAESVRVAAACSLDDHAEHNRRGPLTVRWIYIHMIEELCRHAGHADIIREQILAGRP